MKNLKWLIITIAAAVAAGGFTTLEAQTAAQPQPPLRAQLLERAKSELGLTGEQAARVKVELAGEKDTLKGLIAKLHEARTALREAIQAPDATESSVRAASAKVAAVDADLAVERLKIFSKLSAILTADQREKLKALEAKINQVIDNAIDRIGDRLNSD